MERRDFLKESLAAGTLATLGGADSQERTFYEIRTYELRNDMEPARIQAFFSERVLPAARRAGMGPIGVFTPEAGMPNPSLVVLLTYRSLDQAISVRQRTGADDEFSRAWRQFETGPGLPYVRFDASLYQAFAGHPGLEMPARPAGQTPRIFEWRVYESKNVFSLQNKIDMFNREEIAIFRRAGMAPVLFGEALFGTRLPNLTYMVAFDTMEARMKAWDTFRAHPDWVRVRDLPGWTNAEAVSATRTVFLRPTAFSDVR